MITGWLNRIVLMLNEHSGLLTDQTLTAVKDLAQEIVTLSTSELERRANGI